jgi:hemerythrin-like metal-binding protein
VSNVEVVPVASDLRIGWPGLDVLHAEFDAVVAELQIVGEERHGRALVALHAHLLRHFGLEEQWMSEAGFPGLACHQREHQAVLTVLEEVTQRCADGDHEVVRRLAAELPRWFEIHANTMDAALAQFLLESERAAYGS